MISPTEFIEAARQYKGVKFIHQGRSNRGVDCVGLVVLAMKDTGIPVVDVTDYNQEPDPKRMLEIITPYLIEKPISERQPGDLLWMKFVKQPQHIAIVTDKGIIHSYSVVGKVIEHGLNKVWLRRAVKCFSVRGVSCE